MARCLEIADQYRGRTAPNPLVGCVIVDKRGHVIAEGAHKAAGKDHGEIAALKKLGRKAPGATLYVNLEPCNHQGRTPPCTPQVMASGVTRVVIGMPDPVQGHGGGIEKLRRAGIAVSVGVLREACERHNTGWLSLVRYGRPSFTLKAAITLDGKIATVTGQSKWITGDHARADVMRLRDEHDAVLVGVNTVIADDPWLTARIPGARDPIRIVIDSQLRTPPGAHLLPKRRGPRTIIVCSMKAPERAEKALVAKGAEVWRFKPHANGRVDLWPVASRLGQEGLTSVLVEGGGEIHEYFLRTRLADEAVIYIAPKVVGGPAKSWVGGKGLASLASAHRFTFDDPQLLGGDVRITGRRFDPPVNDGPIWDDD
ncbi:MAG: bifunctional diaminohydroxyphosphoribosylaminopyrimidine deaminase/5-amino-6-(5-phosphoribosylamino)uracil reductase RibD [Deltaproteobacteria bacterium]|nr:bifunctional diaminohydroxyphosphoribosylaminopyrimidine deaminase/5-amino-6-(5-phosphoribosylamino)uracil reductase RibD [Deltaproteobacteria bacterium]